MVIAKDDLLPLAEAVDALAAVHSDNALLAKSVQSEYEDLLSRAVKIHLKIPVTKTSGQSSLEHVAACFAHASIVELTGLQHFSRGSVGALQRYI